MLADVVALPPFWNKWSWPTAKPIVLGSLPGVVLGVFLYSSADADLLRVLLGLISLAFVSYQVLQIVGVFSSTPRKLSPRIGALVGTRADFLVPEKLFFILTYAMLLIIGIKLLWDGLSG